MVLSIIIIILVLLSCNLGHRDAVAEDIRTTQNTECPTGYDPVPGGLVPIKCQCAAGWGTHIPGWQTATYPTIPPTCRLYNPETDPIYTSSTKFPGSRGKCMCFPCPSTYSSRGNGRMNTTTGSCRKLIVFHTQLLIRTTSGVRCARVALLGADNTLTTSLNALPGVEDRSLRVNWRGCGIDPNAPAGEVRYLLNFEISYFGNLDMRTKTMQTIKTNSPNIGICAYGVCDAVQNSTGKTDTVVRAAAQTTPFPKPVSGCNPPNCDDRVCAIGKCNSDGQCSYQPRPNGTACVQGIFAGKCSSGMCAGLLSNIRQASQGITEPVVFTARMPSSLGGNNPVFVRSATTSGAVGTKQWGQLWDDGKAEHYDVIAGDGVYTNTLNITFDALGANGFAAVQPISGSVTRITPQLGTITVFRISTVTPQVETDTANFIATYQRQVNELVSKGSSPKEAIDRVFAVMKGTQAAAAASSLEPETEWGKDVPLTESELALAASEEASAAAVTPAQSIVIDKATIVRVSDRRIEFRTSQGLPGVVMATNGLDRQICIETNSTTVSNEQVPLRKLLEDRQVDEEVNDAFQQKLYGRYSSYINLHRKLLQEQPQEICPFIRGKVLILSPFIANFACFINGGRFWKDEVRPVSLLYRQAGYRVTFKCNNPAACPEGRPLLTDFTSWSGYAAVLLSSLGDTNIAGTNPIILTRAKLPPPPAGETVSSFAADWRSGRIILHGLDGFALTPAWFQKYGSSLDPDRQVEKIGTVLYFSVDRSARGLSPPLPFIMQTAVPGSVGFAGYSDYVSRKFNEPRPGTVLTNWLLSNKGTVANYPCENATDLLTGARFRSWVYNSTSTLADARNRQMYDRCRYNCNGVNCGAVSCQSGDRPGFCNALTKTCDVSCDPSCNRVDGDNCTVRGLPSTCKDGVCQDKCGDGVCAESDCLKLASNGTAELCEPATGKCDLVPVKNGTLCQFYGTQQGSCQGGVCRDLCANVNCTESECLTEPYCDAASGTCMGSYVTDGSDCVVPAGEPGAGKDGLCSSGRCRLPTQVCDYIIPTVVDSGPDVVVWGDGSGGTTFWDTAVMSKTDDCPDTATLRMYPVPKDCSLANASLVARGFYGLYFLSCFAYENVGSGPLGDFPIVGRAVEFEPLEEYGPDRIINIRGFVFGEALIGEDCSEVIITITNSRGRFVYPTGFCLLATDPIPYLWPNDGGDANVAGKVPIPHGEKTTLRFTGFDAAHVLSIKKILYSVDPV